MAALGLCCCAWDFLWLQEAGLFDCCGKGLLIGGLSKEKSQALGLVGSSG